MANRGGGPRNLQRFRLTGLREIGTEIGRGSYASVVEFQFRGLKCVGKKLHRVLFDNATPAAQEGMLQRFSAECEILSELKHPNIVQFLGVDFEQDSQLPILVMEFVHTTLAACVDRYRKLPDEVSYSILDGVATALCYLHGHDPPVIHRDLSANNVLLTPDMHAKVSDLGVAKILDLTPAQMTRMTVCPGTPAYMPPEALDPRPTYGTTLDSFSYGILMLHVFSGRWPLPGQPNRVNPLDPTQLIPQTEAERRDEYFQDIGENHPLEQLIHTCLSNHPGHRPNIEEILHEVREVATQFPPSFEDKLVMINQHVSDREEKQQLEGEVQRLASQMQGCNAEQIQAQMSELRRENDTIGSLLQAKQHELTAAITRNEAHRQMIAAKNQEIDAKHQQITSQDLEIVAKDQEIEAIRSQLSIWDDVILPSGKQPQLLSMGTTLKWRQCSDIPVGMSAPQSVVIDDELYVGGGHTIESHSKSRHTVYKYDSERNAWSDLPLCPVQWFGLGKMCGSVVAVGGYSEKETSYSNVVFTYDKQTQQWTRSIPPMPTCRCRPCVISCEVGIAVCGGVGTLGTVVSTVEVFRIATRKWSTASPLPVPLAAVRATIVSGNCYLLGGFSQLNTEGARPECFSANTTTLFQSSPRDSVWEQLADIGPGCCPVGINQSLVAVGGGDMMRAYSASTNSWVEIGHLPQEVSHAGAAFLRRELIVFAGKNKNGLNFQVSVFAGSWISKVM